MGDHNQLELVLPAFLFDDILELVSETLDVDRVKIGRRFIQSHDTAFGTERLR